MNLNIYIDKKYYKSDSIVNGRIAGKFFETLSKNIFNQSYSYWKKLHDLTGSHEHPLEHGERNIYSTLAVAVNKISPIHLSEWSFNQTDCEHMDKNRRIDIWCLYKDGEAGNPINYFIELKKGWYNLNEKTQENFDKRVSEDIKSLVGQIRTIKKISPQWESFDDVFLGLTIIYGYYRDGEEYYDEAQIRENIYKDIDKRNNMQLITATWTLPEKMIIHGKKSKCRFICIAGIVLSNKR
ncbi:MAG: hypothetical protein HOM14_04820 [Gammaproteobacteria bacterium]|jgi:hypothetical protein|nr:hypothetical protein [Gammaproteobacteria bacterium]MBT3722683.1 hypothetical protein [Gammaproteobacteria bacterium]MBT4193888.1 hypothetical protein [Gammaproteobacteria bacterium]MBT4451522.1 hypothetical protein [Gammaproteobacteria bacterium]MBT4861334.1 hypothetical protein [Gammaproteobacteria bacterium]